MPSCANKNVRDAMLYLYNSILKLLGIFVIFLKVSKLNLSPFEHFFVDIRVVLEYIVVLEYNWI